MALENRFWLLRNGMLWVYSDLWFNFGINFNLITFSGLLWNLEEVRDQIMKSGISILHGWSHLLSFLMILMF